jgi:hypothetical protein
MRQREKEFLKIAERAIFGYPRSPYLHLLKAAGCEWGDLHQLVDQHGLEAALSRLRQSGVYVTLEEFKGRRGAKRGAQTFHFTEEMFDNPYLLHHFEVQSGGTRSAGTRVMIDFDFISAMAADTAVLLDAHGLRKSVQGIWLPLGGTALVALMIYARLGQTPTKWFSQIDGRAMRLSFKYRTGTDLLLLYGRLFGHRLPWPEFAPVYDSGKVAAWIADMLKARGECCLTTFASSAVRICLVAKRQGLSFRGASFVTIGEPLTAARRREIESVGAKAIPRYAVTEAGILGYACGTPGASDDMHLLRGNLAVIQGTRQVGASATEVPAFFVTSLLRATPKILLNVESGDYGAMEERRCDCLFNDLGYSTHLSGIRSFEKLTSEGVTFAGADLLRVIEEVLPARFGGHATDYQVVEKESPDRLPQLLLIVSPRVGEINESEVIKTFLSELGKQTEAQKIMAEILAQAFSLRVQRTPPLSTQAGKILPFHLALRQQPEAVTS